MKTKLVGWWLDQPSTEKEDYWIHKRDYEYYGHLPDQPVTHIPRQQKGVNMPNTRVIKVDETYEMTEVGSQKTNECPYQAATWGVL